MRLSRRFLTCLVALACALPLAPATQAAGGKRTATRDYVASSSTDGARVTILGPAQEVNVGGAVFGVRKGERYVKVSLIDQTGARLSGQISLDRDGDGNGKIFRFCGSSKRLRLGKTKGFGVFIIATPCSDDPAVPTTGKIKAVFTR